MEPKSNFRKGVQVHEVTKSENDIRNYRALVLNNGLKVLLASDPTIKKSAASMSVAVGSMNDPPDIPGLAHLCEHMLFIEPKGMVNAKGKCYSKFISENGGTCNAFTTRDQTNYHFDVGSSAFVNAVTRFSKFFTTMPEFPNEAFQEQELKIINSEHENRLTNDAWRKFAVEACTAKPGHPFGHFSTGNVETLWETPKAKGINVLERLKDFHSNFYSASIMSLVITSREDLDTLEGIVVNLFSEVRNTNIVATTWPENPYGLEECQKRVDIVPLSGVRDLYVCFPMPDSRPWFKTFPHGYLANLLGHKGPGSLFSLLSSKQWVINIYLNSSVPARGFGYLTIGIQLTVEGLNHVEEIVGIVFDFIAILKKEGPQRYFWEELQSIFKTQFLFMDEESAVDFVQRVSNFLHVYPIQDVLSIGYILDNYDEDVIKKFVDCLNPLSCRIMTIAKENDKYETITEKWYGVKYRLTQIDPSLIQQWNNVKISGEMGLPPKNLFLPSKFNLKYTSNSNTKSVPRIILENQLFKAWFYQDTEIPVPKAFIRFELFSFLPRADASNYNYNHIMAMMFKESVSEPLYNAILAGLNYTIKGTLYGMEITVDGYDERIQVLVRMILERFFDFDASPRFFQANKDSYTSGLLNASSQQPYAQVPYYFSLLMREKRFSDEELLTDLNELKVESIHEYHKQFVKELSVECLIYGNLTEPEAITFAQDCNKKFRDFGTSPLFPNPRLREVLLPSGTTWVYKKMLNNANQASCCAVLFQVGSRNMEDNVLLELFDQLIDEPCFNQLRNQEQLGYIVRTSVRTSNGTQGLLIVVQGARSPEIVHERIDAFLNAFKAHLHAMSIETFSQHKAAVSLRRNDAPKKLMTRANRLWNNEIYSREYNFRRNQEDIKFLQTVDVAHIISFYEKFFVPNSPSTKCIVLYLQSPSVSASEMPTLSNSKDVVPTNNKGYHEVTNITDWKSNMKLSPLFQDVKEVKK